jgi:tetratricopeptide (TPR) repeat protein
MNLYRARAFVNEMAGHASDAIADYRTAVEILDALLVVDPSKTSNRVIRAEMQQKMAKMLADSGQMAEATRYGKAGVGYLNEQADQPDAPPQTLVEASYANMEPPIPSLVDLPRAIRYAQRADKLTQGKNPVAVFYLAQAYEDALDGPQAMAALQRFGALLPPTPPGQKPSRARLIYEKHLKSIQYLVKTGHLQGESK